MYKYICERCGHEFFTKKKEQRFCSKSCANSISTSRRKIFDISIFDKGLNHTTAYILGIIISDGCLSYDEHSHRYRITISMNEHKLVEFLRENYSPSKKLYSYSSPKGNNTTYTFITTNTYDIEYLKNIGVSERKSSSIRLPIIKDCYRKDLIRGIFDGDGSVYVNNTTSNGIKYKYINASITTGSELFADDILDVLKMNGINAHKVKDSRINHPYWYIKVYAKRDIKKFYNYLYTDAELYLDRKKNLFDMMI